MAQIENSSSRRYPGLKPFDRSQNTLFRGRQDDILRLSNLVLRSRLTVLFAKSGIGKTSLLQAGVAPEIEEQGYFPIVLRLENTNRPLVETIRMALTLHATKGSEDNAGMMADMPETIWELMKRLRFETGGLPATPVLVFDQFEEVFTLDHSQQSKNQFLEQLGDLCNESTPEPVHEKLLETAQGAGSVMLSPTAMQWWDAQPDLRVVLSIRSDFLHKLDEISTQIPGILRNRYQLQPLNRTQATEAIVTPAAARGSFASPVFQYAETALNTILDFLSARKTSADSGGRDEAALQKKRDEIEAFNLQIICQNIEEEVIRKKHEAGFEVTPEFYGGVEGLQHEINDFYIRQIKSLPDIYMRRTGTIVDDPEHYTLTAQRLIEEDLITPSGRRNSVVLETLLEKWHITQEFLDVLVETRLLRKELRLDSYYFEISHDTLLPVALASRDARRAREKVAEERERLTRELEEEAIKRQEVEKQLREMRRQRRLARSVSLLSVGLLIVSAIMGVLFFNVWAESVQKEFLSAEENCRKEQFDAAIDGYQLLSTYKSKNWLLGGNIAEKGEDALRFKRLFDAVNRAQVYGDSLFFLDQNPDYSGALTAYRNAADTLEQYRLINYQWRKKEQTWWRVDPERIADRQQSLRLRISSTRRTLITQFVIHQREAEAFKEAGLWGQQRRNLLEMKKLLPVHQEDLDKLDETLNLSKLSPKEYVEKELNACQRHL